MNETEDDPTPDPGAADPVVAAALQTIVPPDHAPDFWDRLEVRLTESPADAAPAPAPPPALETLSPPLAEVVPLSTARRSGPRWMALAAAVLAVVAVATSLLQTNNTEVMTTAPPTPSTASPAPTALPASPAMTAAAGASLALPASPIEAPEFVLSLDGVGPLRLGMTTQDAQATGALQSSPTGTSCPFFLAAGPYRFEDFSVVFLDDRLAQIVVGNELSRIRTPQGIGLDTPPSLLSEIPGTRVETPSGSGATIDISTGDLSYQFYVVGGRIVSWSVGTRQGQAPRSCP